VQSIVRPPRLGRTEHYTRDDLPPDPQEWLAGAEKRDGSWWPHWAGWLAEHSGARMKARRTLGSAAYAPIATAPGEYVLER
jgi:polyhydroxyalkanoate synthase